MKNKKFYYVFPYIPMRIESNVIVFVYVQKRAITGSSSVFVSIKAFLINANFFCFVIILTRIHILRNKHSLRKFNIYEMINLITNFTLIYCHVKNNWFKKFKSKKNYDFILQTYYYIQFTVTLNYQVVEKTYRFITTEFYYK